MEQSGKENLGLGHLRPSQFTSWQSGTIGSYTMVVGGVGV